MGVKSIDMFGVEIIRKGSAVDLYKHVDRVLAETEQGRLPEGVNRGAVAHALQRMLKLDHWMDVCTIRDCEKFKSRPVPSERMQVYRSTHCVHWRDMEPDFRQKLVAMVLDDFRELLE